MLPYDQVENIEQHTETINEEGHVNGDVLVQSDFIRINRAAQNITIQNQFNNCNFGIKSNKQQTPWIFETLKKAAVTVFTKELLIGLIAFFGYIISKNKLK